MTHRPDVCQLWLAIESYLSLAYDGAPPSAVRSRLATLKSLPPDELYDNPAIERDGADPAARFSIRLGNRSYPHMKLTVDRRPDGQGYLYRADTHDRHITVPPESQEYPAFVRLMKENQELAQAIENRWEQEGLPTFKGYLRQDLARRTEQRRQAEGEPGSADARAGEAG